MNLPRVMVIAYGNPLRGDDGLAWHAADELKKQFSVPHLEIFQRHQLAPEVAEEISHFDAVIFVDAASVGKTQPGEICISEIREPDLGRGSVSAFHHQCCPGSVLALAAELYGARPRAFVATLTGQDFNPGEHLSTAVERAMPGFVARIDAVIQGLSRLGP
jgi:hydrogenase maturation protease